MIKKTIKLCGKEITLAYCFATEIEFKMNADCDIEEFIIEVAAMFNGNTEQTPDIKKCIYLIYAAALAYAEQQKEEVPITVEDMMYQMQPTELGAALATITLLRSEFYHVPKDEPKEKTDEKPDAEPKNA